MALWDESQHPNGRLRIWLKEHESMESVSTVQAECVGSSSIMPHPWTASVCSGMFEKCFHGLVVKN